MSETTILHLHTDSACVHKWITDTLMGKARVPNRAAREMLIRRWLDGACKTSQEVWTVYGCSPGKVRT